MDGVASYLGTLPQRALRTDPGQAAKPGRSPCPTTREPHSPVPPGPPTPVGKKPDPAAPGTHEVLGCVCGRQRAPCGRGCGPPLAFLEWGLQEGKGKGPRSLRAQSAYQQQVKAHSAASSSAADDHQLPHEGPMWSCHAATILWWVGSTVSCMWRHVMSHAACIL